MRLSSTNIATAGAFLEDIKSLARKSPALMRLLIQAKTEMTASSRDLLVFTKVTQSSKEQAKQLGLWARVWQSMQSVVANFRARIANLVTSLLQAPSSHPAKHHHHQPHNHAAAHQKAMHHHRAAFRPASRPNVRPARRRGEKDMGLFSAEIEQLEDALWMVRDLAEGFPEGLPPDDMELQLNRWIPWEKYSLTQQAMIKEAIHRVIRENPGQP